MKLKSIAWSFLGLALPLLVAVFCIPLTLEKIGSSKFALLSVVWAIVGYASALDFGVGRALIYILSTKDDVCDNIRLAYINAAIHVTIRIMLYGLPIMILIFYFWSLASDLKEVGGFSDFLFFGFCIFASIFAQALSVVFRSVCESGFQFGWVSLIRIGLGVLNFGLPLLAANFGSEFNDIVFLLALSKLLGLFFYWQVAGYAWGRFELSFKKDVARELLSFGGWHTLGNLVNQLGVVIERLLMSSALSFSVVAVYAIPYEVAVQSLILLGALTTVVYPYMTSVASINSVEVKKIYLRVLFLAISLMLIVTCVFYSIGDYLLVAWLGEKYEAIQYEVLRVLGLGLLFYAVDTTSIAYLQATGRVKLTGKVQLRTFCFYVPILFFLISEFGVLGAAFAWVIKYAISSGQFIYAVRGFDGR